MRLRVIICLVISFAVTSCVRTNQFNQASGTTKQLAFQGIEQIKRGRYAKARHYFSIALKQDPKDCQIHFLNALSYQLEGKGGSYRLLDVASVGYQTAVKFCPRFPWAYYYWGLIEFQKKNYTKAEFLFSQAYRYGRRRSKPLLTYLSAFIDSAYRNNDLKTINALIRQLKKVSPHSELLKQLQKMRKNLERAAPERDEERKDFYKSDLSAPHKKQVFVDAIVILARENEEHKRGVNLLSGLQLQYGNSLAFNNYSTNGWDKYIGILNANSDVLSGSIPSLAWGKLFTNTISIPTVTYNLNIFNDFTEHDHVLSRPTLLASDGVPATYFVGKELLLGVSGINTGEVSRFPIGLMMSVTPTFLDDGSIDFNIEIGREVLTQTASFIRNSFANSAQTIKENTKTKVNLRYGETVIISALTDDEVSNAEDRTPGLAKAPIIGNFFRHDVRSHKHVSLLVLLTPHYEVKFKSKDQSPQYITNRLRKYYEKILMTHPVKLNLIIKRLSMLPVNHISLKYNKDFYGRSTINSALTDSFRKIDEF